MGSRYALLAIVFAALISLQSCASERDNRDLCTLKTVGEETGAEIISATLLIPQEEMIGVNVSNGGIKVMNPDCDAPLNAFLSGETVDYLIGQAETFKWVYTPMDSKVVDAELYIWRFRDGSDEPRFFVGRVIGLNERDSAPSFADDHDFEELAQ